MSTRRSGKVVSLRIRPLDCLSILDVCDSVGIKASSVTFPMAVGQALHIMLEAQRLMKNIPERRGFEWDEMMSQVKQGFNGEDSPMSNVAALLPRGVDGREKGLVMASKLSREELREFERLSEWRDSGPLAPGMEEDYHRLLEKGKPS